jgi:hypothetical protein
VLRPTASAFQSDDVRAPSVHEKERSRVSRALDVIDVDRATQH